MIQCIYQIMVVWSEYKSTTIGKSGGMGWDIDYRL